MKKKLQLGFIGAGGVSVGHYQRIQATGKAEVAALADPSKASIERFHKRSPGSEEIPVFPDHQTMLDAVDLDGVLVLTPHAYHYEHIRAALNRGLHVLAEKPLVCRRAHARSLIRLAKKSRRVLSLSYQRHYEPVFRYMRAEIQKGRLGEIQFVQAMQAQEWLRLTAGTWRQDLEVAGGGQLHDSGSHLIDIVLWATGLEVAEVYARGENFGTDVDVNAAITLMFTNGALGNLSIIGNAPAWHEDHTIVGSKGALHLREDGTLLQQDGKGKPRRVRLPARRHDQDSNFVDCILGKATTETPPSCGLKTLIVTEALWKSIATGRPVRPRYS